MKKYAYESRLKLRAKGAFYNTALCETALSIMAKKVH
jgi:hypothetical protein